MWMEEKNQDCRRQSNDLCPRIRKKEDGKDEFINQWTMWEVDGEDVEDESYEEETGEEGERMRVDV
ncbi:hypothetical protein SS1G_14094 [Sclerotinia sclerotiorum 1980 UF-70]|uniref:Uncharacterized protein n=1 Tax=Sclerotinia sclerotiorum (strain ATCC 18683 / 1980 / Ss-1) TaxID=665079 RepID=A7F913_SCLS1|nr:hypothetical protein SS1G_14094 [Sclerotinia sclerotiorum 1980 UF-70]EDN99234.1 hypothetical protein SS1G_14094 [Sclerotinia sclerotiorum 1980 UF-70]